MRLLSRSVLFAATWFLSFTLFANITGKYEGTTNLNKTCRLLIEATTEANSYKVTADNEPPLTTVRYRPYQRDHDQLMYWKEGAGYMVPFFFHTLFVVLSPKGEPESFSYTDNMSKISRRLFKKEVECKNLKKVN
jgi:hypothetical protein